MSIVHVCTIHSLSIYEHERKSERGEFEAHGDGGQGLVNDEYNVLHLIGFFDTLGDFWG